jgi:hypothetical protein
MKVKTDLKSGNYIQDVGNYAKDVGNQFMNFFGAANQQAELLTSSVSNSVSDLFTSLKNGLSIR